MTFDHPNHVARRRFLKLAAGLGASPLLGNFVNAAYAAGPFTDYRALVCIFLYGGNDSHNLIVPRGAEYGAYSTARGNLALPDSSLVPVLPTNAGGRTFGFHPRLPKLAGLFNTQRKVAVMSNVGVLLAPTTLSQYRAKSVPLPPQLFSHSDMQNHNQTGQPADPVYTGWGGRMADMIAAANASSQLSISVSAAGSSVFMKGRDVVAYNVSPFKADPKNTIVRTIRAWRDWDTSGANPQGVFGDQVVIPRGNMLEETWGDFAARAVQTGEFVRSNMYTGPDGSGNFSLNYPVATVFPGTEAGSSSPNRLAAQLKSVALMIAARQALGVRRQVFFVSHGGFDNHGDQFDPNAPVPILAGLHANLLTQVDDAMRAFYDATIELGVASNVTSFTMSDFGRTLNSNGKGSDHGWGGHQLVMGGAVTGGALYGTFPTVATGTTTDVGQGRLLPTTAIEEYGATFANWMGVSDAGANSELDIVFPNLDRFSRRGMGFLV
jgi:uncharacterized protein (DUF1501 family)